MTSAWVGDTVPASSASRVRVSEPHKVWACLTRFLPSPCRSPPRWVSQSPVDP